jgi:hypothetical protein
MSTMSVSFRQGLTSSGSGNCSLGYPPELKQSAERMFGELPPSDWAAMCQVAQLPGLGTPETRMFRILSKAPERCPRHQDELNQS